MTDEEPPASFFAAGGARRKLRRPSVMASAPSLPPDGDIVSALASSLTSNLSSIVAATKACSDDALSDMLLDERAVQAATGASFVADWRSSHTNPACALGQGAASGSEMSRKELSDRALALSRAGALHGAHWPDEAAAAASAMRCRVCSGGEGVWSSRSPSFLWVLGGSLERRTAEPDRVEGKGGATSHSISIPSTVAAGASVGAQSLVAPLCTRFDDCELVVTGTSSECAMVLETTQQDIAAAVGAFSARARLRRALAVRGVPLLRAVLTDHECLAVADASTVVRVRPGAAIASQGSLATGAYVLLRGHVRVVVDHALAFEGDSSIAPETEAVATLEAGAVLAADALLRPRFWRATALAWHPALDSLLTVASSEPAAGSGATPATPAEALDESAARSTAATASHSSDTLLLHIPRSGLARACGRLLPLLRERDPTRFAEELGRLL